MRAKRRRESSPKLVGKGWLVEQLVGWLVGWLVSWCVPSFSLTVYINICPVRLVSLFFRYSTSTNSSAATRGLLAPRFENNFGRLIGKSCEYVWKLGCKNP